MNTMHLWTISWDKIPNWARKSEPVFRWQIAIKTGVDGPVMLCQFARVYLKLWCLAAYQGIAIAT